MELAIKLAPHHIDWHTMLEAAVMADDSGVYEQFWNFDHFYPIQGDTSGIALGSLKERFDRFDEGLEVLVGLLADEETSFEGDYYQLEAARNEPKGPQQPLPICIGGGGEKRTLRSVARYASHWNLPTFDVDTLAHKLNVLAGHCAAAGTDVGAIKVSSHVMVPPDADAARVVDAVQRQREANIDQCIAYFQPPVSLALIDTVTEALAAV